MISDGEVWNSWTKLLRRILWYYRRDACQSDIPSFHFSVVGDVVVAAETAIVVRKVRMKDYDQEPNRVQRCFVVWDTVADFSVMYRKTCTN